MAPSVQAVVAGVVLLHLAQAQPALTPHEKEQLEYTRAHYTKYEFRIPMRDGIKLFTAVYVPKDFSQHYPLLLLRTPYSVEPYGTDNYRPNIGPSAAAEKEGFIFAYQDVRGRYMSEGTFIDVPPHKMNLNGKETDESTDTYDTVDWLIKNVPNNNGRVGMWGISYPGFFAAYGLINSHPALKAISPQAPMGDVGNGDDAYHNGAFQLAANFEFYTFFKARGPEPERPSNPPSSSDDGTPDAYEFFLGMGPLGNANERFLKNQSVYWNDVLKHPAYDEFWQTRAQAPHMKNVTPATLFVGGWFDAEDLAGPLKLFRAVEKNGPKAPNTLVMGPWCHGCWARTDGRKRGRS
jgi:putative CocE/NonD family hydrolase